MLRGTFMGGLCLGSLLLPRWLSSKRNPFAWYALLELFIGTYGVLLLALLPMVGRVYSGWLGGAGGFVTRGIAAAFCLLQVSGNQELIELEIWPKSDRPAA